MPNEIVTIEGSADAEMKQGSVVVRTGRRYNLTHQVIDDRIMRKDVDIDISMITDKFNDRFDDPEYYTA